MTFFGLSMLAYGSQLAAGVWGDRLPIIGISKGWDYIPIAVGGVIIALFSVEKILLKLSGEPLQPMPFLAARSLGEV